MMAAEFLWSLLLLPLLLCMNALLCVNSEFQPTTPTRICEPIRIELCRGIGYNETSLPNIIGHEMQSEVEFVLQTFTPLIEYICSTQLKLFLCAAYVPMCTPKVTVPIGPCRNLCENVRSRCLPVLQGFGFPWPPALDCNRFPRENNHETMCMEGPGEMIASGVGGGGVDGVGVGGHEITAPISKVLQVQQECYGMAKSHLYIKLNRSGRCAPICDADILFNRREKNFAEMWIMTWTYAALGMSLIATLCYILSDTKNDYTFAPLIWCNDMVVIGWTVRFMSGRDATACGYDPQLPNVALLLVDGLANPSCAATFLLRYYFGMASCAWWSIICLDWHREVRKFSKNSYTHRQSAVSLERNKNNQLRAPSSRIAAANTENPRSNLSVFIGWGIPAFQTAAVIVARFIDADELIGSCYAGNQSEKGLQALVATPLFCYWIFGTMNLVSGYLVDRNTQDRHQEKPLTSVTYSQQRKNSALARICPFLFIYSILSGALLIAVIYEFLNIDLWLNSPLSNVEPLNMNKTPMWPFLTRPLMELILAVLTSAWVLGPIISNLYKIRRVSTKSKQTVVAPNNNIAYACGSYQTVWQPQSNIILLNQISANKKYRCVGRHHLNRHTSETIL